MNKPQIEKEYKVMIDEEKYTKLVNDLEVISFVQTNFYYDTNRKDCSMRIREVNDKFIFTLKQKGDGFKYEYEFEIPNNSLVNDQVNEVLNKFEISNPKYLGQMVTTRSIKKMEYGELCIDKSTYNNKVDYELEYELYDYKIDKYDDFIELLNKYEIEFIETKKTKLKRFLESL